jgi:hypothetical protein
MGWAGNVYHGVEHWIETELEWDIVIQNCPPSRISTLRYEDLVFHPKYHLNRISDFFGIPFDGKMIRYFEDSTYDAPDPSLVQQWKCQHSPRELALIEGRVGELLISRGYDSSGYDPIRPTSAERISLWFRNKLAVWNILLSRYGLVDSVLLALARHLNLPSLSCNARKRMDAKTVKYLR